MSDDLKGKIDMGSNLSHGFTETVSLMERAGVQNIFIFSVDVDRSNKGHKKVEMLSSFLSKASQLSEVEVRVDKPSPSMRLMFH